MSWKIHQGDALAVLRTMPDESVHCCVTSPPYWGLRDYGHDDQLGLERTPEEYVEKLVAVFREVRRVLRSDGTLWLVLGDSYASIGRSGRKESPGVGATQAMTAVGREIKWQAGGGSNFSWTLPGGQKPKDLIGIPWRVAFALQADGWWLRSDIIWCLSGGARVYARTQKGEMPMSIKDLVRLDPATVQLWNGEKWTQALGWSRSESRVGALEIELRSGERIGCTPGHQWPTDRGLVQASELVKGDVIDSCQLPEPAQPFSPRYITTDVAWFLGLYLAEGSWTEEKIQIAAHVKDAQAIRNRIADICEPFGGTVHAHATIGNAATIIVECPILAAIVHLYIHGRTAKTKGLKVRTWRHSNVWLKHFLNGYLFGDAHHDKPNKRWRLGFTRNDRLAADLRTLAARLGFTLTLRATTGDGFGKTWPIYKGELRETRSGHHNERPRSEVMAIRRGRARQLWDIGVSDAPNTFALASGVLTHNSKPNPMPESVTDRPTKAHEYLFLLTKAPKYHYDAKAIAEEATCDRKRGTHGYSQVPNGGDNMGLSHGEFTQRNKRTVWTIPTHSYPEAHFATYPPALVKPCILAGTSAKGCCPKCGAPWERIVSRERSESTKEARDKALTTPRNDGDRWNQNKTRGFLIAKTSTVGFKPTCSHNAEPTPCTVLDPFTGSGTTLLTALRLGRNAIGIELNQEYVDLATKRIQSDAPLFY